MCVPPPPPPAKWGFTGICPHHSVFFFSNSLDFFHGTLDFLEKCQFRVIYKMTLRYIVSQKAGIEEDRHSQKSATKKDLFQLCMCS